MDTLGRTDLWLVGYAALAILLFAAQEVAAGLLRDAGGDLWEWLKRRRVW